MTRLKPFAPDVWIADGPDVPFAGVPYSTRMTVIRLSSGDLFIHSPIPADDELLHEVDGLGRVAHLVSPNAIHHLFMGEWKLDYPEARLIASPGLAKKRKDLTFDAELHDEPDMGWAGEIDQVIVHGSFMLTEVEFFHRASKTLIVTDLIQRFPPEHFNWWQRIIMRAWGLTAPMGRAPRELKASFMFGRKKLRRAVRQMIDWAPDRIIIAHGLNVEKDAVTYLKKAFDWV